MKEAVCDPHTDVRSAGKSSPPPPPDLCPTHVLWLGCSYTVTIFDHISDHSNAHETSSESSIVFEVHYVPLFILSAFSSSSTSVTVTMLVTCDP